MNKIPISYIISVYNEEKRIRYVLDHAVKWADEILIINKSSTDKTKEICLSYREKIRVIDKPYSIAGDDTVIENMSYLSNDWIFAGTSSEIPTRKLILKINEILSETKGELDLIYIPKKYYSMGVHSENSPWHINYAPFVINRKKTIITNKLHESLKPIDPENTRTIKYEEDCCVYHLTHPTAQKYFSHMTEYFESEAKHCINPDKDIQECFEMIVSNEEQIRKGGVNLLGAYCAWPIYWLGKALFIWEKYRGVDVEKFYNELKKELIKNEWSSDISSAENPKKIESSIEPKWYYSGDMFLHKVIKGKKILNKIADKIRSTNMYKSNTIIKFFLKKIKKLLFK